MIRACCLALLCLSCGTVTLAQEPAFELTVDNIMRGPEHVGEPPADVRWSADGRWIYFRWKPGGRAWHEPTALYRVAATGGRPESISDSLAEATGMSSAAGDQSRDGRWRVVAHRGDLFLVGARDGRVERLTDTRAAEHSPRFSRDGRTLYYVADDDVFARPLGGGAVRQLTDIRKGPAAEDSVPATPQQRFLEQQQRELFEHVRVEAAREQAEDARAEAAERRLAPQPIHLERDERITDLAVDPDGRYVVISTARGGGSRARSVDVPYWVTASGYTELRDARAKVGDAQAPGGRVGIVSVPSGSVRWFDVGETALAGDTTRTLALTRFLGWNDAGSAGLMAATSADFKDAWLWSFEAGTGALTTLAHNHDEALVAGPCAFWSRCAGWLPGDRGVWFVSERDGFAHLYATDAAGHSTRQLTSGSFEVHGVELSPARDRFFLHTSEGSPHQVHFYSMPLDGSERVRITSAPGRHQVTVSPDGARLAIVHSTANRPPELYVAANRAGAPLRQVTTSPTAAWLAGPWIVPDIVLVPARDGRRVPARIYQPAALGAPPNGAAVIFVHGAGYLQNVHEWWSTYYREYMFHHLLAQRGYVVLDLDYRGSAGYGREWRTAIYRHMGGKDLSDQVDAVRWLQQQHGIDPERVGIYGGSYGGFITLMALFTEPKSFGAGAALRSVTDWAHYNHPYTGRILNLPHRDTLAYRRSSPIYFAEGLEDPLLIAHGMVDTNVHFSDVVRLAQRLIELGKTDWELAVYPVEDHAFVAPSSWTDEYRRILRLFETALH